MEKESKREQAERLAKQYGIQQEDVETYLNDTEKQADFIQDADKTNGVNIVNGIDANRLLSYVERIEHLEAQRADLQNDINEILKEAESADFHKKAIKELVKIRKKDDNERKLEEFIVDQYRVALGID